MQTMISIKGGITIVKDALISMEIHCMYSKQIHNSLCEWLKSYSCIYV